MFSNLDSVADLTHKPFVAVPVNFSPLTMQFSAFGDPPFPTWIMAPLTLEAVITEVIPEPINAEFVGITIGAVTSQFELGGI
jgi:hypothetical protein